MDFQTPPRICKVMADFLPDNKNLTILEPTAGLGNLVSALKSKGTIISPEDFFKHKHTEKYDYIVMNPPFSPMTLGYKILYDCMELSDNIIALMPWMTMINGDRRTRKIVEFGLRSITHLPRTIFKRSRVQTCILEMEKGFKGEIVYRNYFEDKKSKDFKM